MSEHTAENDVIVTDCHEWAIQCYDRDGSLFTGRPFTSRREAEESGKRLTQINGAEWWLTSRRRIVTVNTEPWTRVASPGSWPECATYPNLGCACRSAIGQNKSTCTRRRTGDLTPIPTLAPVEQRTIHVTVEVDTDELREWAGRHADAGRHGVAHALYDAATRYEAMAAVSVISPDVTA